MCTNTWFFVTGVFHIFAASKKTLHVDGWEKRFQKLEHIVRQPRTENDDTAVPLGKRPEKR